LARRRRHRRLARWRHRIIGAVVGGWLLPRLGIFIGGGFIGAIINALIGAVIVLLVVRLVKR
jgi:uncharacterized membrane protein YeaQ/YmgE (transglycosylase-associated protein family)